MPSGVAGGGAALVRARRLAVGYDRRAVVGGIDLEVAPSRALALVGTNGSGKSTVLKTLVGLLAPVAGQLDRVTRSVAWLSQFHPSGFVLPLRAGDVVRMGRYPARGLLRRLGAADGRLVAEAMERMGVGHLADEPVRALSGGQRQRVFLAQALARQADLVVLDEPTAGLDVAGRELYLRAVTDELARGAALVTATHDIGEAQACHDVLLLAGRVVAHGAPAEVLRPEHLLDAFGIALRPTPSGLFPTELPHGHPGDERALERRPG